MWILSCFFLYILIFIDDSVTSLNGSEGSIWIRGFTNLPDLNKYEGFKNDSVTFLSESEGFMDGSVIVLSESGGSMDSSAISPNGPEGLVTSVSGYEGSLTSLNGSENKRVPYLNRVLN